MEYTSKVTVYCRFEDHKMVPVQTILIHYQYFRDEETSRSPVCV